MDIICLSSSPGPAAEGISVPLPAQLAARATSLRGVSYTGGRLCFDPSVHTEATADLLTRRLKGEQLAVTFQGGGTPAEVTDEDLRVINDEHSSVELSKGDVVVFEDYAANDRLTRKPIRLTKRAFERFAENYTQGREVNLEHNNEKPVGATFAAKVIEDTMRGVTANWLVVRWYAVTKDASELRLQRIQDMRTGVRRYTSVGLMGGEWEFQELEGKDGETIYFYEVDDNPGERDRLESDHLARVSLGAVYGAGSNRATQNAQPDEQLSSSPTDDPVLCAW